MFLGVVKARMDLTRSRGGDAEMVSANSDTALHRYTGESASRPLHDAGARRFRLIA
jgi:hypothetical protein